MQDAAQHRPVPQRLAPDTGTCAHAAAAAAPHGPTAHPTRSTATSPHRTERSTPALDTATRTDPPHCVRRSKSWRLLRKPRSSTTRITSLIQAVFTLHLTSSAREWKRHTERMQSPLPAPAGGAHPSSPGRAPFLPLASPPATRPRHRARLPTGVSCPTPLLADIEALLSFGFGGGQTVKKFWGQISSAPVTLSHGDCMEYMELGLAEAGLSRWLRRDRQARPRLMG